MSNDFLWVEKYRPATVSDCILPQHLKTTFQSIVENGELPNMLFSGTAGTGKTTVAKAMCKQLGLDYILINGSEEGNIDTLRGKIKQFASSVSLTGGYKVVILDEADYLNPQSTQPALRGFIEEFANNCRFILTCNFKNRIIEPLHSRCGVYEFNATSKQLSQLAGAFYQHLTKILDEESITHNPQTTSDLVLKHAPDWRRVINEVQRGAISGFSDVQAAAGSNSIEELVGHLRAKKFKSMRKWVAQNVDIDTSTIFRGLFDVLQDQLEPDSVANLVVLLAEYQYKDAFVADHELNMVACLVEVMNGVRFIT